MTFVHRTPTDFGLESELRRQGHRPLGASLHLYRLCWNLERAQHLSGRIVHVHIGDPVQCGATFGLGRPRGTENEKPTPEPSLRGGPLRHSGLRRDASQDLDKRRVVGPSQPGPPPREVKLFGG